MSNSALDTQVDGDHYTSMVIQPVDYIHANRIPFIEGNVIKYVSRWRNKNGPADLEKARHCIDILIEKEAGKQPPDRNPIGWSPTEVALLTQIVAQYELSLLTQIRHGVDEDTESKMRGELPMLAHIMNKLRRLTNGQL